jgi:hypothetical protein
MPSEIKIPHAQLVGIIAKALADVGVPAPVSRCSREFYSTRFCQ